MSDQSDKQEDATPKKIKDARKKGQIPKSPDFPILLGLLFALLYFWMNWSNLKTQLKEMLEVIPSLFVLEFHQALGMLFDKIVSPAFYTIMLPFSMMMVLAGIIGNVMQFGFIIALDPILPKMSKINPADGAKRIFSLKQLVQTLLSLAKTIILAIILFFIIKSGLKDLLHDINQCNLACQVSLTEELISKLLLYLLPALIVMAVADFMYQRIQFMKDQRMSKEEVKQEMKESFGDPHIRGALSGLRREISEQDIHARIRTARLLILDMGASIALQFEQGVTPLPVIVAIGKGMMARKMVEIAQIENVPMVSDPALAQLLIKEGKLDFYIPEQSIDQVAKAMRKTTPKG